LKRHETQKESYTLRGNAIGDKKIEIDKMDKEQKEIQMSSLQKEVGEVTMKLKNELSLESTNVQICKARKLSSCYPFPEMYSTYHKPVAFQLYRVTN
jgi:hypothetical protein